MSTDSTTEPRVRPDHRQAPAQPRPGPRDLCRRDLPDDDAHGDRHRRVLVLGQLAPRPAGRGCRGACRRRDAPAASPGRPTPWPGRKPPRTASPRASTGVTEVFPQQDGGNPRRLNVRDPGADRHVLHARHRHPADPVVRYCHRRVHAAGPDGQPAELLRRRHPQRPDDLTVTHNDDTDWRNDGTTPRTTAARGASPARMTSTTTTATTGSRPLPTTRRSSGGISGCRRSAASRTTTPWRSWDSRSAFVTACTTGQQPRVQRRLPAPVGCRRTAARAGVALGHRRTQRRRRPHHSAQARPIGSTRSGRPTAWPSGATGRGTETSSATRELPGPIDLPQGQGRRAARIADDGRPDHGPCHLRLGHDDHDHHRPAVAAARTRPVQHGDPRPAELLGRDAEPGRAEHPGRRLHDRLRPATSGNRTTTTSRATATARRSSTTTASSMPGGSGEVWIYDPGFCDTGIYQNGNTILNQGTGESWTVTNSNTGDIGANPARPVSAQYDALRTEQHAVRIRRTTRSWPRPATRTGAS